MKPTVVLLPGMDGTGELFSPLVRAMDPSIPTVIVRYPDVPTDYGAHEVVARAALPGAQSYVLLGESFSGPVAVSIAASRTEHCVGLILARDGGSAGAHGRRRYRDASCASGPDR